MHATTPSPTPYLDDIQQASLQPLRDFYRGKTVLLTGGTGLLGKVLLERMLSLLPDITAVYVLVRPKTRAGAASIPIDQRLKQEVFESQIFEPLKDRIGDAFEGLFDSKVHAVSGDVGKDSLGLDPETYKQLQGEVDIIIHCAAVVSFDAPLDTAVRLNTLGPGRMVEFAKGCKDPFFAQVSTCYVNATRKGPVPEDLPDPTRTVGHINGISQSEYDVEDEIRAILAKAGSVRGSKDQVSRAESEQLDKRLSEIGMEWAHRRGWQDVYTFSKAMGEQMFVRSIGEIRGAIIRPAIIEGAWKAPVPGWLNGFRMLDPLIVAYGRGRMIDFPGKRDGILDIIPVDMVANAILAIVAQASADDSPKVYQIASGMENPITLEGFADQVDAHFQKAPFPVSGEDGGKARTLIKPTFPTTSKFLRQLRMKYMLPLKVAIAALAPCSFAPWPRRFRNRLKLKMVSLERLYQYGRLYGPYAEAECKFLTNNTRSVMGQLHEGDRESFDFDIGKLDWESYLQDVHIPGVKKYLLGMDPESKGSVTRVSDGGFGEEAEKWFRVPMWIRCWGQALFFLMSSAIRWWTGFRCEGLENVPDSGPYIIASNHNSHMDTPVIFHALGRKGEKVHPVAAKDYFFENGFMSRMVRGLFRAIPFDRKGTSREELGLALAVLEKGHALVFYPEGSRGRPGRMQPFKNGIGFLALMSEAPVVPAFISGSHRAMPKGTIIVKRRPVSIRFGAPICFEGRSDGGRCQEVERVKPRGDRGSAGGSRGA